MKGMFAVSFTTVLKGRNWPFSASAEIQLGIIMHDKLRMRENHYVHTHQWMAELCTEWVYITVSFPQSIRRPT